MAVGVIKAYATSRTLRIFLAADGGGGGTVSLTQAQLISATYTVPGALRNLLTSLTTNWAAAQVINQRLTVEITPITDTAPGTFSVSFQTGTPNTVVFTAATASTTAVVTIGYKHSLTR